MVRYSVLRPNQSNLYDFTVIIILGLLSFGNLGGSSTPLRLIAVPIFIFALSYSFKKVNNRYLVELHFFLVFFLIYMFLSVIWSINYEQALKEIIYFFVHASILLSLVYFARKAAHPIKSICVGWALSVAITVPVAIIELLFDWHLPVSLHEADTMINYGEGQISQKIFASVTFGNWNGYVAFLCFSLPFLIGCAHLSRLRSTKFLSLILILFVGVIVIINASRGGVVAFLFVSLMGGGGLLPIQCPR